MKKYLEAAHLHLKNISILETEKGSEGLSHTSTGIRVQGL